MLFQTLKLLKSSYIGVVSIHIRYVIITRIEFKSYF